MIFVTPASSVTPAKAGIQTIAETDTTADWIPASAGMTE
jgi:hypothetical protein